MTSMACLCLPLLLQAAAGSPPSPEPASASEALAEARKAYEAMEYETAAALATRLLELPGLDIETRLDGYVVQASSLAITADPSSAEVPFRLLLRARPDFDLPRGTSPKILGVFRRVQAEEKAIAGQMQAVARKRLVEGLRLLDEPPARARGGHPLPFSFRLRDPSAAVTAFEVPFRRQGETAWSALALKRDAEGAWRGAIPAEWTACEKPFVLEYYLQSRDEAGPLLARGSAADPLALTIAAGAVPRARPLPRWALWTGMALTGAALAATGGVALGAASANRDYHAYADRSLTETINGAVLQSKADSTRTLCNATLGLAIGAGVLAAATLAVWPFTPGADEEQRP